MLLLLVAFHAPAGPLVTLDSPIGFFTNVASRLLSAQMGLDLNHLQVYPTNQYTPAVHRVLQVTANLYDAATNRPFAGDYPYLPSVFRPLFRREANGAIFIAGYREVADDTVANFTGSGPTNVVLGVNESAVPLVTAPFLDDANEPLVLGIPLVIGARKGLPNFNEFGVQTSAAVSRRLQFRRAAGSNSGPIVETNQMYVLTITNTCGVEVWNSYFATYPRNVELRLDAVMVAVVTNEFGTLLLSNAVPFRPSPAAVPANTWPGISPVYASAPDSFKALMNGFLFLTNAMYSDSQRLFLPPADFEQGNGFPVPQWYLSLRTMLRFALVDASVSPARILDYVSLDSPRVPVELLSLAASDAQCGSIYVPDGSLGGMYCTNRDSLSVFAPTYGMRNQLCVALAFLNAAQWPANFHTAEVDFFRAQFGLAPMYYPQGTFSWTNNFICPYSAPRLISFYTSWQANDPLVHYTIADLSDLLAAQPAIELDTTFYSSVSGIGGRDFFTGQPIGGATPLNSHYRPWGGNPLDSYTGRAALTNWKLGLKDPLVWCSAAWDFPTNLVADLSRLGQVHRGTPWQTIYLKSSAVDLSTWAAWTGDALLTDYGLAGAPLVPDAVATHPTNDWRQAALLVSLLSTNDPRTLLSVNEPSMPTWTSVLDGVAVLTNTTSETLLRTVRYGFAVFAPMLVESNSPQADLLAAALSATRARQTAQRFSEAGDILATPELSVASPFLNQGALLNPATGQQRYTYQQTSGLNEAAYEAIPSQLLPRLRPDSVAALVPSAGSVQVQFTGADGYRYAVEVSSNLVDWVGVSTNYPSNGRFLFQEPLPAAARRFYRSALLP